MRKLLFFVLLTVGFVSLILIFISYYGKILKVGDKLKSQSIYQYCRSHKIGFVNFMHKLNHGHLINGDLISNNKTVETVVILGFALLALFLVIILIRVIVFLILKI